MQTSTSSYFWPGETHFGAGAAQEVGELANTRGATHAFLLTDPGVLKAGLAAPVQAALEAAGLAVTVYDQVEGNPTTDSVDTAVAAFRECEADLIVSVGGGSTLDSAKGVQLAAAGPPEASISEYALVLGDEARPAPPAHQLAPHFALPTTAGTGSEVTPWAVLTDTERGRKLGFGGPHSFPTVALLDPALTLTMPPGLTAATGFDALSHLIEAYVATSHNPALDPMILYGIELIGRGLRTAVAQPDNLAARRDVLEASMIGGVAISSKYLGACHSLAHPLSALADLHHGVAIAIMLPHQMAFSLAGALDRYAAVGEALDPGGGVGLSRRGRAEYGVTAVGTLLSDINLPTRLQTEGVSDALIPDLATQAYQDLNWTTNPRIVSQDDLEKLYREAW